ncbi:MAG TPA: beta-ketoacyl-ACP synthase 3, partial [Spirochaetia bacterium]|nr:beta-ketoacyl-ACP synthase 3 [Spirochaetia bacterium]
LNAAFESGRPTLFFYPKNCLNDRENATSTDVHRQLVPLGRARFVSRGDALTLVGWGNTVAHCRQAASALAVAGASCDVIDLRSLMPWDEDAVLESVERTGRLIVVHEDNHTNGFGAEVVATVAERASRKIESRRVTRADTYVPCNFGNQLDVLPSFRRVLETAVKMMRGSITWRKALNGEKNVYSVEAIGSSPSDESVTVVEWKIRPGDRIEDGAAIATLEADKAAVDLSSPVSGTVVDLLVEEGDIVKVGTPIVKVKTGSEDDGEAHEHVRPITREEAGEPIISGLDRPGRGSREKQTPEAVKSRSVIVSIAGIASARGKRIVTNEEIAALSPEWDAADILKRTGIASRPWLADGESALSIAVEAAGKLLADRNMTIRDVDLLICSTETPMQNTPSMAALIQHGLAKGDDAALCAAYDINAACSGFIYALQIAYDYLQSSPGHRVLVVTTEALSPRLDLTDFGTAPIFGDASTATLIAGGEAAIPGGLRVYRPVIAAHGEDGSILRVPSDPANKIYMDGPKVFLEAIKDMMLMLGQACDTAGIAAQDLDLIVPHQANQRIINAIRQRMKFPREKMYSNIANNGNTSSSTIPLCLEEILSAPETARLLGIAAFGGGFTFGGGVLERIR